MEKTIIVGLGGTGLETIRALRRRVVEVHGRLDALPHLGFLYLDTDPKEIVVTEDNRKRWEVLGVSIQLSPEEYFIVEAPEIGPIVNNIDSFPHIRQWFPVEELRSIDQSAKDTPGARQIRPLGRFALALKTEEIGAKFMALYNRLPQAPGGGKTKVYLVCSLSGGTGSGMFLDLGYRLQEWSGGGCDTVAFLVFPELTAGRGKRYLVNAYAALLELNYLYVGKVAFKGQDRPVQFRLPHKDRPVKGSPFEFCYVVGPRNAEGVEVGLDETLPDMVAHRIYLNFDSSFASDAAALLQNGSFERTVHLTDPFNGNRHSQNFFTFGLSSIQYPIEQITEVLAYQIAADMLGGWLKPREVPGNVNERVQSYLPELHITDDYLLGNKDLFGSKADFDAYDREVENFINDLKRTVPSERIVPFIGDKQRQYLDGFRSVGLIKFYQDRRNDLGGAVQEIVRLLSARVSSMLTDPQLGYDFAGKALEELARVLSVKHQQYLDILNGLPAREKNSRLSMTGFSNELTAAESKLIFREKAIKEALTKVCDALKINLSATIGIRAYEFGHSLLAHVLEEVQALRERLVDWRNGVERLKQEVIDEIGRRRDHLSQRQANIKEFNGALLFSPDGIATLYRTLDVDSATRFVQERTVGGDEHGVLAMPFRSDSVLDNLYRTALEWVTSVSHVRLSEKNVADKLFDEYPEPAARRAKLGEIFRKSAPFLVFDEVQKQIWAGRSGVGYEQSATTGARLAAMLDDEGGALRKVAELKRDLQAATGLPAGAIKKISDTHHILFLQEVTAFPLRLVHDVATLKEHYEEYVRSPQAIPVHLQKQFDPPLMDLFLTTAEEIRHWEEAEEAFLLGWVDGRILSELNRREGKEEIRYRYVELSSNTYVSLGKDWNEAFEFYLSRSDAAAVVRERLTDEIKRYLKTLDTHAKRRDLSQRLSVHLNGLKQQLELGEENQLYQRYDRIRKRIVEKHDLPFDPAAAATGPPSSRPARTEQVDFPTPGTSDSGDAQRRFLTLVRTALRNGKGTLTPAMTKMLRASQTRYRLTEDQAEALIRTAQAEFNESPATAEYREMFQAFFEDGEINDDERAILVERQVELGLNDAEVADIETEVLRKRGM